MSAGKEERQGSSSSFHLCIASQSKEKPAVPRSLQEITR